MDPTRVLACIFSEKPAHKLNMSFFGGSNLSFVCVICLMQLLCHLSNAKVAKFGTD